MIEREKLITAIERAREQSEEFGIGFIVVKFKETDLILELLKGQEAIPVDTKVIGVASGDIEVHCCRDCRTILDPAFHYCPNCGKAVKWDG